jgi:hypothetical protein
MLPVADLDYELEALGPHGVAGSGTRLFWRLADGFPRPRQHIRDRHRCAYLWLPLDFARGDFRVMMGLRELWLTG